VGVSINEQKTYRYNNAINQWGWIFLGSHTISGGGFHLAHIRLPTHQILIKTFQNLVKWYEITHAINPTKYKGGLSIKVVTDTGFTVLRYLQCVMQIQYVSGVAIGGVHYHIVVKDY